VDGLKPHPHSSIHCRILAIDLLQLAIGFLQIAQSIATFTFNIGTSVAVRRPHQKISSLAYQSFSTSKINSSAYQKISISAHQSINQHIIKSSNQCPLKNTYKHTITKISAIHITQTVLLGFSIPDISKSFISFCPALSKEAMIQAKNNKNANM
jgi:hypothetical protein